MNRIQQDDATAAVRGVDLDGETRCAHYDSARDIVAIRFACCGVYYACHRCHEALADHAAERWSVAHFGERAVRCGACEAELSVRAYLDGDHACPRCGAAFNPGCARHRERYFEG